jgi:hypothetical protein
VLQELTHPEFDCLAAVSNQQSAVDDVQTAQDSKLGSNLAENRQPKTDDDGSGPQRK